MQGLEAEYENFLPYDEKKSKSERKYSNDKSLPKDLISDEHELISLTLQNMQIPVEYLCISNGKIYQSFLKLNPTEKKISFINKANGLAYLEIDLKDFIAFVNESYIPEETKKKLKDDFQLNNSTLEEKQFCRITYVPNRFKSKCNFCNLIFCGDCKCRKTVSEKNFYVSFFLISKTKIAEIENELNKINLGLLPKIKELQAKNRKRKMLFFVNPKSGTGISLKIWEKAKSIFDLTDIDKTVIFTNRFKHAYDVVKNLKVGEYDGIVNCSGDGVLHEIVNAICHREDRDIFLNSVTVGALPAGSANGYPKAISDYCGDDNRLETHCYYICKGVTKQIDLQEMELRDVKEKVYSFLSIYYGFIADADLESEGCIGMFRTTIWGAYLYFFERANYGSLYYLPEDSEVDINTVPSLREPLSEKDFVRINDNWRFFIACNTKFVSQDLKPVPKAKISDGYHDILGFRNGTSGKLMLLKELLFCIDNGDLLYETPGKFQKGVEYFKSKCWRFIPKSSLNDPDDINLDHHFTRYYSIDGERYPICPIQVKTMKQFLRVYSGKE